MKAPKKILIAYATAGIGHKKASLAIKEALENGGWDAEVKTIDVLDYTPAFFRRHYPSFYLVLINRLIWLWWVLYRVSDMRFLFPVIYPVRKMLHVMNCAPLIKFLLEFKPDVILSTHFMLPDVCDYAAKKFGFKTRLINVVTDYRAHSFWVSEGADEYFVAHEETKKDLTRKWGVRADCVKVTGIPVEPKFSKPHDREAARAKIGVGKGDLSLLLMSGGYGVGPIFEMLVMLNSLRADLSLIVVCGHNAPLWKKVEDFKKRADSGINIINFGYVDNIDELMAASDVYVGKAGGISTTEALVMGLPLVLVSPIPGQESGNAGLLIKNGSAVLLDNVSDIKKTVSRFKTSEGYLAGLRENIKKVARPESAKRIAEYAAKPGA
ncbi:MAG: glycosyltransferase [Candidatus Omnitrophota bacterium]